MTMTITIPVPRLVGRTGLLMLLVMVPILVLGHDAPSRAEAAGVAPTMVSAGGSHTCARTTGGQAWCWGHNGWGELGIGTSTGPGACLLSVACSTKPVNVTALVKNVAAVAAGGDHTCALTTTGGVKCWGSNVSGRLGDGTAIDRLSPVDVCASGSGAGCAGGAALSDVAAIAAGSGYTCVLTTTGGVKCWGSNLNGRLGDGTTTDRLNPVDVCASGSGAGCAGGSALTDVTAVTVDSGQTCALITTGGVNCWGRNDFGQLGEGTSGTDRLNPVDVCASGSGAGCAGGSALTGVTAIAAGDLHTCALTTTGGAKCWGGNAGGRLGDGTTTTRLNPVDVCASGSGAGCAGGAALSDVDAIAAGDHTCVRTTTDGAKCWGLNFHGQLGDGTTTTRFNPVDVCASGSGAGCAGGAALSDVDAIATGYEFTCALNSTAAVKCWGRNLYGQLGDGTMTSSSTSVDASPVMLNAWYPWDINGDGFVSVTVDILQVARHFGAVK